MDAALASPSALHGVNQCCRIWNSFATTCQAKLFGLVPLFLGETLISAATTSSVDWLEVGVSGGLDGDLSPSRLRAKWQFHEETAG